MSGLSRTPGKRVRVNSPPRVRIPPSPPALEEPAQKAGFLLPGGCASSAQTQQSRDSPATSVYTTRQSVGQTRLTVYLFGAKLDRQMLCLHQVRDCVIFMKSLGYA